MKLFGANPMYANSFLNAIFGLPGFILMDVYTLARLMKPSLQDSNIAIVYAGGIHIWSYAEFLTLQKAKLIWKDDRIKEGEILEASEKCIKIPKKTRTEVFQITEKFPVHNCFTSVVDSEEKLAKRYGVNRTSIQTCLRQTSEITKQPLWKVLNTLLYK